MKIAHLDTGRSWRGGQGQVLSLLLGLRERGHELLLLAPPGPLLERARGAGLPVSEWRARGELDWAAAWSARRRLRRFHPQVAHLHTAHAHTLGVLAARAAGVPAVVVSRRVDFAVGRHPLSGLKYRLPVDRYLAISHGVEAVLLRAGIPAARISVVPSGIDLRASLPAGADLRALLGVPLEAPIVGTVAALAPHKDHATLARAAARVAPVRPDVHFAWVGEGECRPALERLLRELGLEGRVHLLGFRPDARALLSQFTLFALSSHLEGMCTSLLDAQALGIPVVATETGGIPEVVQDGISGVLVPPRNEEALAGALLALLAQPARRVELAEAAARSVTRFDIANTVTQTERIYQEVLAGR